MHRKGMVLALVFVGVIFMIGSTCALAAEGRVNAKDFGAAGDGVTDDAPAIQKAIDSLGKKGGTVYEFEFTQLNS